MENFDNILDMLNSNDQKAVDLGLYLIIQKRGEELLDLLLELKNYAQKMFDSARLMTSSSYSVCGLDEKIRISIRVNNSGSRLHIWFGRKFTWELDRHCLHTKPKEDEKRAAERQCRVNELKLCFLQHFPELIA